MQQSVVAKESIEGTYLQIQLSEALHADMNSSEESAGEVPVVSEEVDSLARNGDTHAQLQVVLKSYAELRDISATILQEATALSSDRRKIMQEMRHLDLRCRVLEAERNEISARLVTVQSQSEPPTESIDLGHLNDRSTAGTPV